MSMGSILLPDKGVNYMNIPEKIKIGYKDYEVKKVNDKLFDNDTLCYGVIHYNVGLIEISSIYSEDTQKCALLHEILHGIDDIFDIGLHEEHIVKLAKGLYQVIKENPEVFRK